MTWKKLFFHTNEEVKTLKKGRLYLCPVGELPYDYLAQLYKKSDYLFFESCEYTNLAINLGKPYLQKAIDVVSDNYPALNDPSTATEMNELSELFAHPISVYTAGVNKQLAQEIAKIAKWLQNPHKNYFSQLQKSAQLYLKTSSNKIPADKLTTALTVFETLRGVSEKDASTESAANSFEEFYKKLKIEFNRSKRLAVAAVLKENGQENLAAYLTSFTGTTEGWIELQEEKQIQLDRLESTNGDNGEICGVSILVGSAASFIGTVDLSFQEQPAGKGWRLSLNGHSKQSGQLNGIPWLTLTEAKFSVLVPESGGMLSGSVSGTFGKTAGFAGIEVVVELNQQTGTSRLMAYAREPITSLKLFGAIAGGLDFERLLPEKLQPVIRLGLVSMEFYYDWENKKISSMSFIFKNQANEPWVLWGTKNTPKLSAHPNVTVAVLNPADLSKRQIKVALGSFVDLGNPSSPLNVGQLWLGAAYPPFKGELRLASEKIELKKLLQLFDASIDLSGFKGEPAIIDLTMLADFGADNYQFAAAVDLDWEFAKGFKMRELGLQITRAGDKTTLGFVGTMEILTNLMAATSVYIEKQRVRLHAELMLNQKITMEELVKKYAPDKLIIDQVNTSTKPCVANLLVVIDKKTAPKETTVLLEAGVSDWKIKIGKFEETLTAKGKISKNSEGVSASLSGEIKLLGAKMTLVLDYEKSAQLQLYWKNFEGRISGEQAVIKLKDFSIGEMIETFIGWLYSTPFSLDTPWNALNAVESDLELVYDFRTEVFKVTLGKDQLNDTAVNSRLPFGELKGISVTYDPKSPDQKKIKVEAQIKFDWQKEAESFVWDAAEPGSAPSPAGSGNDYFKLDYLAFGQKMQFFTKEQPNDVGDAITKLKASVTPESLPHYAENVGMMIASELKFLKESGEDYFLKAQFVFYDPDLYGLKIQLAGKAAKFFAGLSFEILYAKLSEALGVFKTKLVLPDKFRNFDLGAFSISMPDFYIEVYTNGDFYLDIGFPKNSDFSRSFTLSGMVPPGLPLTGSAGLYFGKLSAESAKHRKTYLPSTDKGVFNPVITFGLGLRFGLGKSIHYGPLSGGFALVAQTILEGVIAKWQPYQPYGQSKDTWFYYLDGTAGIVGTIFGKIDFSIININVNLELSLSVKFIYEVGRKIPMTIEASLKASASLSINLGLFRITISFKFNVQIKESFAIGHDQVTPWGADRASKDLIYRYPIAEMLPVLSLDNRSNTMKQALNVWLGLSPTIAIDENESDKYVGVANVMMMMEKESFVVLLERLVEVTCDAAAQVSGLDDSELSLWQADELLARIETTLEQSPFSAADLEGFLAENFELTITNQRPSKAELAGETQNAVYFPLPPSTTITLPAPQQNYQISAYNQLSPRALGEFKAYFEQAAVMVANEEKNDRLLKTNDTVAMGEFVFVDWFMLALRQSVREMRRHLREQVEQGTNEKFTIHSISEDVGGMLSRFSLHGLRLPTAEELITPKVKGLWVKEDSGGLHLPPEAGIFALTGQSFLFKTNETYPINILLSEKLTAVRQSIELTLDEEVRNSMDKLLKRFETGDQPRITAHSSGTEAPFVPEKISFNKAITKGPLFIYEMPQSLLNYYQFSGDDHPEFTFYIEAAAGSQLVPKAVTGKTLIEFSVSPTGQKGVYLIGQASEQVTNLLAKIIKSTKKIETIGLLKDGQLNDMPFSIGQINLSTETRPASDHTATQESTLKDRLILLWKALVTNNQGYVLTLLAANDKIVSDHSVDEIRITFAISYLTMADLNAKEFDSAYLPLINALVINEEGILVGKAREKLLERSFARNDTLEDLLRSVIYSDYGRIAQQNLEIQLNPEIFWEYPVAKPGKKVFLEKIKPDKGVSLVRFADQLAISAATLLYHNRQKKNLFLKQKIVVPIQAGNRIGAKTENTDSLINEQFLIERKQLEHQGSTRGWNQAELEGNHSLLRYQVGDELLFSVPYSDKGTGAAGSLLYDLIVPVDKVYGGAYRSQGSGISVYFQWLDYYGNRLFPKFCVTRAIGYQDPLLSPLKWPGMGVVWNVGSETDEVLVTLKFDPAIFEEESEAIQKTVIKKIYLQIQKQLEDPNVEILFECSLYRKVGIGKEIQNKLLRLIGTIIAFCDEEKVGHKVETLLSWRFDQVDQKHENMLRLTSMLTFRRKGIVAQGYEDVAEIMQTSMMIAPFADRSQFINTIEQKYPAYIVLKGSNSDTDLVAYRQADVRIEPSVEKAEVYLPRPVSNALMNRDQVQLRLYKEGALKDVQLSFRGIDLNQWLRQTLEFVDQLLMPSKVSAAQKAGYDLRTILTIKAAMAEKLSKFLIPAFSDSPTKTISAKARAQFEQQLLGALSNFYEAKAVVAIPTAVSGLPDSNAAFYGKLELSEEKINERKTGLTCTSPKLENGLDQELVFVVNGPELITNEQGAVLPYADLDLNYTVTHLETDRVELIDGFKASKWYGKLHQAINTTKVQVMIPFPLRTFPETPKMVKQESFITDDAKVRECQWKYAYTYSRSHHYPQQVCHCKVRYNVDTVEQNKADKDGLFAALASIVHSKQLILTELDQLCQKTDLINDTREIKAVLDASVQLLERLVEELDGEVALIPTDSSSKQEAAMKFEIIESIENSPGQLEGCFRLKVQALHPEQTRIIAEVEPRIDDYRSIKLEEYWYFQHVSKGHYLSGVDGQTIPQRKIVLPKKKLLSYQSANTELFVEQNRYLGKEMNEAFIFTTGKTTFDSPFYVSHVIDSEAIAENVEQRMALSGLLAQYFKEICCDEMIQLQARAIVKSKIYADLDPVCYPVFVQVKEMIHKESIQATVAAWEKSIFKWREKFSIAEKFIELNKNDHVSFELIFFSQDKQVPFLTIKNAYIEGDKIKLS